jgi:hypothetical protein
MRALKLICLLLFLGTMFAAGQDPIPQIREGGGSLNTRDKKNINKAINQTNRNKDNIAVLDVANDSSWVAITSDSVITSYIFYDDKIESRLTGALTLPSNRTWQLNSKNVSMTPGVGGAYYIYRDADTIAIGAGSGAPFTLRSDDFYVSTTGILNKALFGYSTNLYVSDYTSDTRGIVANGSSMLLYMGASDTVKATNIWGGLSQIQTFTQTGSRVDVPEFLVHNVYASMDGGVAVDSLTGLRIHLYDGGIEEDSIGKLYSIYNIDGGLRGRDATYFLYSEYGDNYLNGDVTAKDYKYIYPTTVDMDDYVIPLGVRSYRYNSGITDFDLGTGQNWGSAIWDTATIIDAPENSTFYLDYSVKGINSEVPLTGYSSITGSYKNVRSKNLQITGTGTMQNHFFGSGLTVSDNDTIIVPLWQPFYVAATASAAFGSDNRVDIGSAELLYLYGGFDDNIAVDSVTGMFIHLRDVGIDPDSIDAVYGIYNNDDGLRGKDKTYFLYSEYGDNYLNGKLKVTDSLQLTNGAGLDQYGYWLRVGSDHATHTARTNATAKSGGISLPHYTNTEEDMGMMSALSSSSSSSLYIGGGNTQVNSPTVIRFNVAADVTTTPGTLIGQFDIGGFLVDTISELTTSNGVVVDDDLEVTGAITQTQLTGSLTDGAPLDAEIDSVTGTTPAAAGAGWQVTILDSDGSGLLYRIESDGTNWLWWVGTVAL